MTSLRSTTNSFLSLLRELPARGLWPYTTDPFEPNLIVLGEPRAVMPMILEGNSRHAAGRIIRALSGIDARVLAIDTGGVDLYTALASGILEQEELIAAVQAAQSQFVPEAPAPASPEIGSLSLLAVAVPQIEALLPYPIWQALDGEMLQAYAIHPGPANPEDLPACLACGGELSEEMKVVCQPLRERAHLVTAHAGLLALISAVPLAFLSLQAIGVGLLMILGALAAVIFLGPHISKRLHGLPLWLSAAVVALLMGVCFGLGAAVLIRDTALAAMAAVGAAAVAGWLAWLSNHKSTSSWLGVS